MLIARQKTVRLVNLPTLWLLFLVLAIACLNTPSYGADSYGADSYGADIVSTIVATKGYLQVTQLSNKQRRYLRKLKQKQLDRVVAVSVLSEQGQLLGQVWGTTAVDGDNLTFTPRFPFDDNKSYFARFQLGNDLSDVVSKRFAFIVDNQPITGVIRIYPSADRLPKNIAKFYIQFSHSMSREDAYQHIALLDENNLPITLPALTSEKLWDTSNKRFTLLLNDTDTKSKIDLVPDKQYTLLVKADWPDAKGLSLISETRKTFTVTQADHSQPDINRWALTLPNSGSRNPVILQFDEPLDRAQLENALWVETDEGKVISGEIDIENEIIWRFTPTYGWRSGNYRVVAQAYLQDRAANSLARVVGARQTSNSAAADRFSLDFQLGD